MQVHGGATGLLPAYSQDPIFIPPRTEKPSGPLHANSRSAIGGGNGRSQTGLKGTRPFLTVLDPFRPPD
jgi:hypothetical protein